MSSITHLPFIDTSPKNKEEPIGEAAVYTFKEMNNLEGQDFEKKGLGKADEVTGGMGYCGERRAGSEC